MKLEGTKPTPEKLGEFFGVMKEMQAAQQRGVFGQCMSSLDECREPPISSHVLAESWLRNIADATRHVIKFEITTNNLAKSGVRIEPRRVGVGEKTAVTFPGFCRRHDSELFSCLETAEFTATPAQLLALTYRSVCREACAKYQMVKCHLPRALDKEAPLFLTEKVVTEFKNCIRLLARKQELEKSLAIPANEIAAYVVEFARRPTMLVSVTFSIPVTFTGRVLDVERYDWTTLSIIASEKGGYAIFTWSKRASKNPARLVKSFIAINRELQSSALIYLALEISENFAIAPSWWASLTGPQQGDLLRRFSRSIVANTSKPSIRSLFPKPPGIVDWAIVNASYV
jgi:hypothetical protein